MWLQWFNYYPLSQLKGIQNLFKHFFFLQSGTFVKKVNIVSFKANRGYLILIWSPVLNGMGSHEDARRQWAAHKSLIISPRDGREMNLAACEDLRRSGPLQRKWGGNRILTLQRLPSSLSNCSGGYHWAYIINAVVIVLFCSAFWLYGLNTFSSQYYIEFQGRDYKKDRFKNLRLSQISTGVFAHLQPCDVNR